MERRFLSPYPLVRAGLPNHAFAPPLALSAALSYLAHSIPSSQTPLLGPSPLRTVHASFLAHGSSTANASFRETRLREGKVLTVNPVVALRMK